MPERDEALFILACRYEDMLMWMRQSVEMFKSCCIKHVNIYICTHWPLMHLIPHRHAGKTCDKTT